MAALPFPPTAIASSSSVLVVASGAELHLVANGTSSSAAPAADLDEKAQATGMIRKLTLNADSTLAVSAHDDKTLRVWNISETGISLRSSRPTFKRVASVSFTAANELVVTDKVGDVFLYPLEPRETQPALQGFKLQADPSLNPDADFLLGHVSVVSQHVMSQDGKRILTADRDEHIRVSRFPKAYVVDKYLFGSEGFVSAIHMPASHGNMLVSAGGEPTLQVWDWEAGKLVSRIEIFPAVLPYRRVRPSARRLRSKRKAAPSEIAPSDDPTNEGFYIAADGSMYPTGQGVCVEKIDSVVVDGKTVVLFFSEGCTAVHSFVLPISADEKPTVNSQSFNYPVLGLAAVPGSAGQVVVTLDASYDIKKGDTEVDAARATGAVAVIEVSADASLSDITASSPLVATLTAALSSSTATPAVLATLSLYPNLSLFPRWPGFEEDEELAGPAAETTAPSSEPASFKGMTGKQLGKLKAQGAAVPRELLWKKSKKRKTNKKDGEESNGAEAEAEAEVPAVAAGDEATQNA